MTFVALEEVTWPEAAQLGSDGAIGLLALASLEQHGPHLPLGTDSLLAEVLAREVAGRLRGPVVVAPVVRAGLSTHHLGFPGSVSVAPDAFRGVVDAYIEGFERMGVDCIAIFSAHGGNFGFIADVLADYKGQVRLSGYSDLNRFVDVMHEAGQARGLRAPATDIHAGALETSAMLAYFPDLVRPLGDVKGLTEAEPGWLDRVLTEGVRPLSESGVLGDATIADATAGAAVVSALADELADYFARDLGTELEPRSGDRSLLSDH